MVQIATFLMDPPAINGASNPWPIVTQVMLFFLVFSISATVEPTAVFAQFRRMKAIGVGMSCQFLLLPMCGGLTCLLLDLPKGLAVPLILVTSSPGGSFSNWWCSLANADLTLSVAMTTTSTVLATVILPINVVVYMNLFVGKEDGVQVDMRSLLQPLGIVTVAVFLGLLHSHHFPKHRSRLNAVGTVVGLGLVALAIISPGSEKKPGGALSPLIVEAAMLPCFLGLVIAAAFAAFIPGISKPERTAIAIETCYQNTSIALTIAMQKPEHPEGIALVLFYGVAEIVLIGMWGLFAWKMGWTYAPAEDGIFQFLLGNYQKESGPHSIRESDALLQKVGSSLPAPVVQAGKQRHQ